MNSTSTECKTKKTILVVDDNPANLQLLTSLLKESDYDVRPAITGLLALATVKLNLPDLILLDVKMPEMDGYEVCRQLKADERTREIPVIFISALGETLDKVRAFSVGGVDYITKPFQYEEVLARVGTHIKLRSIQKHVEEVNTHLRRSYEELELRVRERTAQLLSLNEQLQAEIAERKHTEAALKQSQERYRRLYENVPIGCQTLDEDGRLVDVNRSWLDLLGYSRREVLGRWVGDFVAPKQLHQFEEFFVMFKKLGVVAGLTLKMVHKSGSHVDVELDGRVMKGRGHDQFVRAYCTIRDVTTMRQADEAIQAIIEGAVGNVGRDYFERLLGKMCEWLNCEYALVSETRDGLVARILAMQLDGVTSCGLSYSLAGTPYGKVLAEGFYHCPEGICRLFPNDQDLVRFGAEGYIGILLKNKDSKPIGVLCALSRHRLNLPHRAEEVMNIIAAKASAEIERMTSEEDERRIEKQLHQAQKMEALGTLAGGIAHDFNNILSAIYGYAELSLLEVPEQSKLKRHLHQILKSADRAKDLVTQILTFSRRNDQEPKPLQFSVIIKETMKFLRASLPSTIEIRLGIEPGAESAKVLGDPTRLHQILMNLCVNAGHAMRDRAGLLEINLASVELEADIMAQIPDAKPGPYLKLTVADTGDGMDQEVKQRIFEPYFTTKASGEGTGLGLAVVYGIVQGYGGWINVESAPGKGSTFTIFLPRTEAKSVPERETGPEGYSGRGKVLLVDDEEVIVSLEKEILERFGFEVVATHNSHGALRTFCSKPESFDLVMTDLTMPGMTGVELARELLSIRPDLPIILCSGYGDMADGDMIKEYGFRGFILKPVTTIELAGALRSVFNSP